MTNHSVNDLASSFVEMAKAYERLPQVEAELAGDKNTISILQDTIQRLELKLVDRTNTINDLGTTIHNLEVARNDAELRFLEADDAKTTLVRVLESFGKDIHGALVAVAPVPEPVLVEPQANVLEPPLPFDGPADTPPSPDAAFSDDVQSGQSETNPTLATAASPVDNATIPTHAEDTAASGEGIDPEPNKYETTTYYNNIATPSIEWWAWRDRQIANGNPDPLNRMT
jgi:hypothetical protein